jgi:hypothetical protein
VRLYNAPSRHCALIPQSQLLIYSLLCKLSARTSFVPRLYMLSTLAVLNILTISATIALSIIFLLLMIEDSKKIKRMKGLLK